ncbi:MAG: hypothetical protein RR360_03400 [Raoultibacter sp.]
MELVLTIKKRPLAIAAYVLLLVPIVLFFSSWLQWYIGVPAAVVLIAGATWIIRKDYGEKDEGLRISLGHLGGIVFVFILVVALSGIVGLGISSYDVPCRNATFRDLIDYSWPVIYDNGNAMVYYAAFWLPAALVGKLLGWIGGLCALGAFVVAVITVSYLLILSYLKATTPGKMWLVGMSVVFWSGLMLLGAALMSGVGWEPRVYPLLTDGAGYLDGLYNGEPFNWYYRGSFGTIQLVYNQLLLWVAVPLMLQNRTVHSYMFLGLLVLPYSPWGFLGLIPLLIGCALPWIIEQVKLKNIRGIMKAVFSPANLTALVTIAPIFALYFLASSRTGGSASFGVITPDMVASFEQAGYHYTTQTGFAGFLSWDRFTLHSIVGLILFYLMEFGVYMALIYPKFKKEPLFWVILVWLMLIPLIWVGTSNGREFCMNASIPPLFALMIMMLSYTTTEVYGKPLNARNLCLVLSFTLIFTGAAFSVLGKTKVLRNNHTISIVDDSINTFSDKNYEDGYQNFLTDAPEDTLFFKYLARR